MDRISSSAFFVVCICVAGVTACGGKVVFDTGTGGSGGGSSTHATGVSASHAGSTSTGGSDCKALRAKLDSAVAAGVSCSPTLAVVQCDGSEIMDDPCGCPSVLLNEKNPQNVAAARAANAAWIQAGCGPHDCGASCTPAAPGFCQPTTDATGVCGIAFPD